MFKNNFQYLLVFISVITLIGCLTDDQGGESSPDKLSESQGKCLYEDQSYELGESFKDKDDCNTCTCSLSEEGTVSIFCTLMACIPADSLP